MRNRLTVFLSLSWLAIAAQPDSIQKPFTFLGYSETYYAYDFGKPQSGLRPSFLYNHTHHNQVNANLVFVKLAYAKNRLRFNLAPMLGTYSQANLAGEPYYLRQIFEANVGVKLLKEKELWLDAGVLPSHIGFESAISKDCATFSRSMVAENTPYFETGIKLSYQHNSKWAFTVLAANGWQKIHWQKGKSLPSFGTQIVFTPNDKITFNYSTFLGTDNPDSIRKMRYYHNLYAVWNLLPQLALTFNFDLGTEQKAKGSSQYNIWFSPVFVLRYLPISKIAMAARYEFYSDKSGVMINYNSANGFQTHGASLNLDYIISPKVLWRIEGKILASRDKIFDWQQQKSNYNFSVLSSLAILLSK